MANPNRGEVDYDNPTSTGPNTMTLKFSNSGRRATEDMLNMESQEILRKLDSAGDRIKTALFWGATRKHHMRDFPSLPTVDNWMDEFADAKDDAEDGGQELEIDLITSLMAAYLRRDKKELQRIIEGNTPEDAEEEGIKKAEEAKKTKKIA
ncbi:MAG: hypothetical protein M3R38_08835 [Actinomycetota bacterium]|nr:hypothetical protein [Actinomycetota bacterium]